jgi:hypothetical protein
VKVHRALAAYPPLPDSAIEGNPAHVTGKVVALEDTVVAPLTGRVSVIVRTRARRWLWGKIYETFLLRPFAVADEDRLISIDGTYAMLHVRPERLPRHNVLRENWFLALHGHPHQKVFWRFEEIVVRAGMHISVGGVIMRDTTIAPPTSEQTFRTAFHTGIKLVGSKHHPLVIISHGLR